MPQCTLICDAPQPDHSVDTLVSYIRRALQSLPLHVKGNLSIRLVNDAEIIRLNHQFRGKNYPTNVLSFPADEPDYLGDIAISLDTVRREAAAQHKTFAAHLSHMIVHGVLHLLGYDHLDDGEAEAMESLEVNILAILGLDNPYQ